MSMCFKFNGKFVEAFTDLKYKLLFDDRDILNRDSSDNHSMALMVSKEYSIAFRAGAVDCGNLRIPNELYDQLFELEDLIQDVTSLTEARNVLIQQYLDGLPPQDSI